MNIINFEIRFFAVGDSTKGGDAILIRLIDDNNDTKVILIDGGYQETGGRVVEYMNSLGLDTIHVMINTHPDLDHISGLTAIMESNLKVEKLIYNRPWRDANLDATLFKDGRITDDSLNKRLTANFKKAYELEQLALDKQGCEIVHPCIGNSYFDCFYILGPSTEHYREFLLKSDKTPTTMDGEQESKTFTVKKIFRKFVGLFIPWFEEENTSAINETSVITWLVIPEVSFLFTGDAGKVGIQKAIDYKDEKGWRCPITHLQLPHHGSRKNINPSLIRRINAHEYFISCPAKGEEEGHPSQRLVNKILEIDPNANIQKNREERNFVYHSDGLKIIATSVSGLSAYDTIED